jgi:N,N-dimethylformamidase
VLKLIGYADRLSVAPGETVRFMVSAEDDQRYRAELVRIVHGDANPQGPGFEVERVPSSIDGSYQGRRQAIHPGSHAIVPDHPAFQALGSFTLLAMIWPTMPDKGQRQTLLSRWDDATGAGFVFEIRATGELRLIVGDGHGAIVSVSSGKPLRARTWYLAAAAYDAEHRLLTLVQKPRAGFAFTDDEAVVEGDVGQHYDVTEGGALVARDATFAAEGAPLVIAGRMHEDGIVRDHYNGKIDSPVILDVALPADAAERAFLRPRPDQLRRHIVAAWDLSKEIPTTRVVDVGPNHLHGRTVNLPARAMKGWSWTGESQSWVDSPGHYGAIHFHDDDLYDAGWQSDFQLTLPDDMKSAAYAVHVWSGDSPDHSEEDFIPFFVRPPRGAKGREGRPRLAFLAPTASYLAYANDQNHIKAEMAEMVIGRMIVYQPADVFLLERPELGLSLYDVHEDGSGVCYSSHLRPVINMRPRYHSWLGAHGSGLWQLNADTHILGWLERESLDYDVITDEDLHRDGLDILTPYLCVVTGTHPEYHSTAMWDALKAWQDRGGRLVYLGANGWYWRIAWHDTLPGVIEVRRAEDGIRTWEAEPGEYYQSFNGEYGGLWRRLGRPPNVICGLGFTAQGFDVCSYYRRKEGSYDPRASWIFDGVEGDVIGDFGLVGGGAAGLELDRVEMALGSPPNTLTLASSEGHSDVIMLVNEEFTVVPPNLTGSQHPNVRADLCFYETAAGGAVFSVGSIAWCGSLSHNGYDNNVARITGNVVRRFLDPTPFPTA